MIPHSTADFRAKRAAWLPCCAVLALLPLAGCMRAEKTADMAGANVQAAAQAQTNPTLSTTDSLFIDQAARAGLAEVQAGKIAEAQAHRAAVREFGAQMVRDHTMANDRLMALARDKRITPPTAPSDYQLGEISQLQTLYGEDFDHRYLDEQVADHEQVIKLFEDEARNGTDPAVKQFAASHVDLLEHHLEEAEKLGGHAPTT